jgi:hypothetical protein
MISLQAVAIAAVVTLGFLSAGPGQPVDESSTAAKPPKPKTALKPKATAKPSATKPPTPGKKAPGGAPVKPKTKPPVKPKTNVPTKTPVKPPAAGTEKAAAGEAAPKKESPAPAPVKKAKTPEEEAQAQKEADGKEHFLKGKALVEEGAWEKAIVELRASYELNPNPIALYNTAICYDELTRYAEAVTTYTLFVEQAGEKYKEILAEVQARIKELSAFLGTLKLTVDPPGAEVRIDGSAAGVAPLAPITIETGEHELSVILDGYKDIETKVVIVSGQTKELSLTMARPAPVTVVQPQVPEKKNRKTLHPAIFWSMVGLAGAAAVSAVVTGSLAVKKDRGVEEYFEDETGWASLRDEGKKLALSTDIMIGVAAAAGASALVLSFFTDFKKKKKEKPPVALTMGTDGKALGIVYEGSF